MTDQDRKLSARDKDIGRALFYNRNKIDRREDD